MFAFRMMFSDYLVYLLLHTLEYYVISGTTQSNGICGIFGRLATHGPITPSEGLNAHLQRDGINALDVRIEVMP